MIYRHTNINSKDWKTLCKFYEIVFDCKPVGPERDLHGEWFDKVTGVKGAHVRGQHMTLPGYGEDGPTFEIFTYNLHNDNPPAPINGYGFAHVAFEVDDVERTYNLLMKNGGSACGEIVDHYYTNVGKTIKIVYARDPEGNVIEILNWY